ncbi:MAG: LacI family DNA-binding transcriptional regulator [Pseudomonadota bacterium]
MTGEPVKKRANVRDVARAAQVSVATVSRVLNGGVRVAQPTRDRVEAAIHQLRFVPNSAARAMNSGRSRLVGALIPTLDQTIFARFIDALEAELDRHSLSLTVASTGGDPAREYDRAAKLLDLGVEALVVSGITRSAGFEALIDRYDVPVVATSYHDPGYRFPTVGYDNAAVARLALDHLTALCHRRIAVLSGPTTFNDRTRSRVGALGTPGLIQMSTEFSFAGAADGVDRLLEQAPDLTAILCTSDILAQGALARLATRGIAVPDRMSVIGMDDLPSSAHVFPTLSTVHLPAKRMGQHTAEAVAAWVERGQVPPHLCLDAYVVHRASTRAL